jgi:hypothetical protein
MRVPAAVGAFWHVANADYLPWDERQVFSGGDDYHGP